MDTSNKYITMCRKAEEIQKLSEGLGNTAIKPIVIDNGNWFCVERFHVIWLPRQDQLQDMVIPKFNDSAEMHLLNEFNKFVNPVLYICYTPKYIKTPNLIFKSMEQLWLAYVMYKKYGKYWNGNEWSEQKNE